MRFRRKRHASSVPWPFEIVIAQKRKTHPSALPWLLMGKRAVEADVEGAREPTEATSRLWHWVGPGWWEEGFWLFFFGMGMKVRTWIILLKSAML